MVLLLKKLGPTLGQSFLVLCKNYVILVAVFNKSTELVKVLAYVMFFSLSSPPG